MKRRSHTPPGPRARRSTLHLQPRTPEELALVYYNYRHYNPADGRWISRDPLEEVNGYNLYLFVGNSPTRTVDYRGTFGLIGATIGFVIGAVGGAIVGGLSGEGIVAGLVGGAVGGAIGGTIGNPVVAGAVAGAVTSAVSQIMNGENPFSGKGVIKTATSGLVGGVLGGVGGKIAGDAATTAFGARATAIATSSLSAAAETIIDVASRLQHCLEQRKLPYPLSN